MRGVEVDDKMMNPFFPRLQVSETEKAGGPRAPPRNKMAVYEHLTLPPSSSSSSSQRFIPSMVLPLPPTNSTTLLPPPTYVGGVERSIFMPFPGPSHLPDNKPFISFSHSSPMNSLTLPQVDKRTDSFQPPQYCLPNSSTSTFSWSNNNKIRDHHEVVALQSTPAPLLHCSTSGSIIKKKATDSTTFFPSMQHQIDDHAQMSRNKATEDIVDLNARIQADHDIMRLSRALLDPVIERSTSATSICRTSDSSPDPMRIEDRVSPSGQLCRGGKECEFVQESVGSRENKTIVAESARRGEKLDAVSETSGANSQSCSSVIIPNHVRNAMGEKQFWKARKNIINQQRIFNEQVFELHRLVEVQRLIAGSPHLLHQQNSFTGNTMIEPTKKLTPRCVTTQKPIDNSSSVQICDLNVIPKLSPLDYESVLGSSLSTTTNNIKPSPPLTTTTTPTKCLQAGNQWLVPVMSPSEGLVYKPYSRPMYPPTSSRFNMVPQIYGVEPCRAARNGDIFTTTTNPPPLSQHAYFPQFGTFPTQPFSKENQNSSVGEANNNTSLWNSAEKLQSAKEGCTTNHALEEDRGDHDDALPLFPLEPMVETASDKKCWMNEQRARVIKVVPHNPGSASESAARIFRFIQEERKRKYS